MIRLASLILAGLFSLAVSPVLAQTTDGETPSEEGVCDVLADGTPGLFGLCDAYCEAQDCDSYPEGEQPRSCDRLLVNYNRLQGEQDPAMPCATPSCPCWTTDQLAEGGLALPAFSCHWDVDPSDDVAHFDQAFYFDFFNFIGFEANSTECLYENTIEGTFNGPLQTTAQENQVCRDQIHALFILDFGGTEEEPGLNCNEIF